MHHPTPPRFRKTLLALAASAALIPATSPAIDMVQAPPLPTSKSSYVAPNVIISVDDSGSMNFCLNKESTEKCIGKTNASDQTTPNADGTWPMNSRRMNVLKYALKNVFSDKDLIPDNKIRIAWQAMWNNGKSPGAGPQEVEDNRYRRAGANNVSADGLYTNSMKPLKGETNEVDSHRKNFLDFVNKLDPGGVTPSHIMFQQADDYLRNQPLNKNSAWSSNPGGDDDKSTEFLGCRRNYHIMMTDGRWNGIPRNLPDSNRKDNAKKILLGDNSTYYTNTNPDTKIYRDTANGTTLADWAFFSWATPLKSASSLKDSDKLKPPIAYTEAPATETFGTGSNKATLNKFWNPRYDPATWPHMVTYTIGFSQMAYSWDYGQIAVPSEKTPFNYDGGFPGLTNGSVSWPDLSQNTENQNALDLWHAAINGRGRFYAVSKGEDLEKAFREIIGKINEESAPLPDQITSGSGSGSGYNATETNIGIFGSIYNPKNGWSGSVTATKVKEPVEYSCPTPTDPDAKCMKFPDPVGAWQGKTTAQRLDELSNIGSRVILSWSDKWNTTAPVGGVPFVWKSDDSNLSSAQKALLGKESSDSTATVATKGENILNYIRGDQTLEQSGGTKNPSTPFRKRMSRQGDIVNSDIWYTGAPISNYALPGYGTYVGDKKGRTPMLYVGGNDGMLHGFSAEDGHEKIAYVPRGVISNLKNLADPDYEHQYFVDGSPMSGDVYDINAWKTIVVGTLGAGGKGYFALDVTDPSTFSATAPKNIVILDRTLAKNETKNCSSITNTAEKNACNKAAGEDADIGNITAKPSVNPLNKQQTTQITRLNNDRWAVILGNGYNSTNQKPVLLIQYLDGDKTLVRIQATNDSTGSGNAKDNGLSAPTLVDLDGNSTVDIVYAGDNLGNLWKFDLTSNDENSWKVSFGKDKPLFSALGPKTAGGSRTEAQPITAPPIVRPNDREMLVGSGSSAKTVKVGGMMVAFGTGRNITEDDRRTDKTQAVQTVYSILDNTRYRRKASTTYLEEHPGAGDCNTDPVNCVPVPTPVGTIASDGKPLAKQKITTINSQFSKVEAVNEIKKETMKNYKGWYLDLTEPGERTLKPMEFHDGSNILLVKSETPSGTKSSASDNINESCVSTKVDTSNGTFFGTLINIMDGKRPSLPTMDLNGDGTFDTNDQNASRIKFDSEPGVSITTKDFIQIKTGDKTVNLRRMPEQSMRPTWRQVK